MCLLDYSVNEAPDASDASETLGHFAVFRGCVHAPAARRVLMRFTSNYPLQCFCVSGACAVGGAINCFKTQNLTLRLWKNKKAAEYACCLL